MTGKPVLKPQEQLLLENEALRARLDEAETMLDEIHNTSEEKTQELLAVSNQPIPALQSVIEAQKQEVEALREHHARLNAMIENIGDVIAIVGADGITKYQSPNIEKWFGWKPIGIKYGC